MNRIVGRSAVVLVSLLINIPIGVGPVLAQQSTPESVQDKSSAVLTQRHLYQYAAKFVCVTNIPGTSSTTSSVLPGVYATVINVHNSGEKTILLRKKIAVTDASGEEPGPVSKWIEHKLENDQAFSVGCEELTKEFGLKFIHGAEGFLVIQSTGSLDVVGVYTAGKRGEEVASIAVEEVHERVVR